MIRKKTIFLAVSVFIFVILMAVFAFTDLRISQALYNPENLFAKTFELIGMIPLYLSAASCGLILFATRDPENKKQYRRSTAGGAVLTFLGLDIGFNATMFFVYFNLYIGLACFIVSLLLTWLFITLIKKVDPEKLKSYRKTAVTGMVFLLTSFLGVQVIKLFWGRIRFFDLAGPGEFTPWYIPQGFTGNQSFPSAHVAGASAILFLTLLSGRREFAKRKGVIYVFSFLYILAVALGRIIGGAHYASDVLFAFAFSVFCLELSKKITGHS